MSDAVLDTTVVAFANSDIAARRSGNSLDRRLRILQDVVGRRMQIRYNPKLLTEYQQHITERRNDVIELFFAVLDSSAAIRVGRNTLSRQHFERATGERWPAHDQHLLAAAMGGDRPQIYVTERRLSDLASGIHRKFRIRVRLV